MKLQTMKIQPFPFRLAAQTSSLTATGLALGLAFSPAAIAQANSVLNPCPSIYYEEPFNRRFLSPQGCPPNMARQLEIGSMEAGITPARRRAIPLLNDASGIGTAGISATRPAQPPLPEERSEPIAQVAMTSSQVDVRLTNGISSPISYQVLGGTEPRMLLGGDSVMLTGILLPTTITAVREDGGLLDIAASSDEANMLDITLNAEPTLDETQGVLRIQQDGQVFVN